jgi:hypothetical protein
VIPISSKRPNKNSELPIFKAPKRPYPRENTKWLLARFSTEYSASEFSIRMKAQGFYSLFKAYSSFAHPVISQI